MPRLPPLDPHDQAMTALVHPTDWPAPVATAAPYNLVVVGGGTAGLIAALGAAGLGGTVALIERQHLGGDCLVNGCVPSKALLAAAHTAHLARRAADFGVNVGAVRVDFGQVMSRMRRLRAEIAHHDAATKLAAAGVDVVFGAGRFTGTDSIVANGTTLRFARAIIATGARAQRPPIPGVELAIDNEGVFALATLPARLVVVGGGPIGCELGQAFQRFGSEVSIVEVAPRILINDDADAAEVVARQLQSDGIMLYTSSTVLRFEAHGDEKVVIVAHNGTELRLACDIILLATGRKANVEGLGLDLAVVADDRHGVVVDDRLRTSNPRIYAAGDVASRFKFTHAADALARIAVQNALFFGRRKASDLVIPWSTFTDPELAHVGIGQDEANRRPDVQTFQVPFADNDRSALEGESEGFVRVYADRSGRILGATAVGRHAGEVIAPLALAMTNNIGLAQLAGSIHAYPTRMGVLGSLGNQFNRTRLTPSVAALLRWLLRWRR
jgi:pyruvate/2-oxoglutarate dehydrogenase complex dihydrolipoamide dehydrogenase (E3) component